MFRIRFLMLRDIFLTCVLIALLVKPTTYALPCLVRGFYSRPARRQLYQTKGCLTDMTADETAALEAAFKSEVPQNRLALLLRSAFHDAGTWSKSSKTGGPNGSVMLEAEFAADPTANVGIDNLWPVMHKVKANLIGTVAENMSFADLVAASGAYAISASGGPTIKVKKGREDVSEPDPSDRLPLPFEEIGVILGKFESMGFTAEEMVTLSGAHTIGNLVGGASQMWDNNYYQLLLQKKGNESDLAMLERPELKLSIEKFANDGDAFIAQFSPLYTKMVNLGHEVC